MRAADLEVLEAMQEFVDEAYDAVRGSGEMSAAYVVGACEALLDRFRVALGVRDDA